MVPFSLNVSKMSKRILITGHTSFAAQGIAARLVADGWEVDCFSRRVVPVGEGVNCVQGSAESIHLASGLAKNYDVVINYLIVKNGDIQANERYLESLMTLCRQARVSHLIHLSSISVYPASATTITEANAIETDPLQKGSYGSLKVAADLFIQAHLPSGTKVSFVRPGFILAPGLTDPIVGMAFRTPYNRLLLLGRSSNTVPLTSRDHVHEVVRQLAGKSAEEIVDRQPWLVVDPQSPSRLHYLQTICEHMGFGEGVLRFPVFLWLLAGAAGNAAAILARMKLRPYKILSAACRKQSFVADFTSQMLKVNLCTNWPALLKESLERQQPQFAIPDTIKMSSPKIASLAWLGFGRIVQQKHLPAIKKLKISPAIAAYDVAARVDVSGQRIDDIRGTILPADMYVVATPGPVHGDAIPQLQKPDSPVLIEKPLAYSRHEFDAWLDYSKSRSGPVSVCHNYRFKSNVEEMFAFLRRFNPGELKHVNVQFQSPPVANESAVWLRNERQARTLLMDYGIHFLDLACMFSRSSWQPIATRHELNERGETSMIQGTAKCDTYSVSFLLRQGSIPRKAVIQYVFQNYDIRLSFFPDVFTADMSGDSSPVLKKVARRISAALRSKVLDKLTGRDSDDSHAKAFLAAWNGHSQISVESLSDFYNLVFGIADQVYGPSPHLNTSQSETSVGALSDGTVGAGR